MKQRFLNTLHSTSLARHAFGKGALCNSNEHCWQIYKQQRGLFSCRFCGASAAVGYLALNCFALAHTTKGSSGLSAIHLQHSSRGKTILKKM